MRSLSSLPSPNVIHRERYGKANRTSQGQNAGILQANLISPFFLKVRSSTGFALALQAYQPYNLGYNAFVDICLALLPATFIWTLALSKAQKVGVSVLLGLGILYVLRVRL